MDRQVVYCNVFSVTMSPFDFIFDFGYKSPEQMRSKTTEFEVVARVAMSPSHAKTMVTVLQGLVNNYEATYGAIPTPPAPLSDTGTLPEGGEG